MQKKCILVYFVKSGPQNTTDSNKNHNYFFKKARNPKVTRLPIKIL